MWANALGNAEDGDTGCLQSISNSQHGRRLAGPHDPFDDHNSGPDVTKEPDHAEPMMAYPMRCYQRNFERASMDVVAARAETSKRSLYAHFESKEKLFLARF